MIVQTDFPTGNGRIHWIKPGHFEVEAIAYSKAPRYICFRISGILTPAKVEVVIRPDRHFNGDFKSFEGKIWIRRGASGEWAILEDQNLEITPEAIRFPLEVAKGDILYISTEPSRPYAESCVDLFRVVRDHPEIASVRCIGTSMEQRPLLVLRVARGDSAARPKRPLIYLMAGEHATEFAGEEIVRGILSAVTVDTASAKALQERFDFEFLLNANPDGNYHGWHQYNRKDWLEHNYSEACDRSWHHEYAMYFENVKEISPETKAIGDWIASGRPSFVLNAHSWTGHEGNPGAFRMAPETLEEPSKTQVELLDAGAMSVARSLGFDFEAYPSSNLCSGHLVDYLITHYQVPAYAMEGHMNLGRDLLQQFGGKLIHRWLVEDNLLQLAMNPEVSVSS